MLAPILATAGARLTGVAGWTTCAPCAAIQSRPQARQKRFLSARGAPQFGHVLSMLRDPTGRAGRATRWGKRSSR